jgi:polyphosphate glucokinase
VVVDGMVKTAPNLDGRWEEFPLAAELSRITGRPARVANDADVQGYGVIEGSGVEIVLTLGTGMGSALFVDGHLVPNLELAHHPLRKDKTYEQYVGERARKKVGTSKWRKRVREVIEQVIPIWNPRMLHIGGGNARLLDGNLGDTVRIAPNVAGILGGIRLWSDPMAAPHVPASPEPPGSVNKTARPPAGNGAPASDV